MVRPAILAEGVGGNGRESCLIALSSGLIVSSSLTSVRSKPNPRLPPRQLSKLAVRAYRLRLAGLLPSHGQLFPNPSYGRVADNPPGRHFATSATRRGQSE